MKNIFSFLILLILLCLFALPALAGEVDPTVSINSTTLVFGALLAISEALALIPALKSNSIFQLAVNILKWFVRK